MRKPFIGILAFIIVLLVMPLGHALMIITESIFGHTHQLIAAFALGAIGAVLCVWGVKINRETPSTWLGFFAGILMWTGWVEFSFVWIAQKLQVLPLVESGEIVTKPEYLVMPSSIGLLGATMLYFFLNSNSYCNFFVWIRKMVLLPLPPPMNNQKRNVTIITAMETVFVLWFFYLVLLVIYDDALFGDRHPVTYLVLIGSAIWSAYLMGKLIQIGHMAPAVRYAIPTVIIFWNVVEIMGRWNLFQEIWIMPSTYAVELVLMTIALLGSLKLAFPRTR